MTEVSDVQKRIKSLKIVQSYRYYFFDIMDNKLSREDPSSIQPREWRCNEMVDSSESEQAIHVEI